MAAQLPKKPIRAQSCGEPQEDDELFARGFRKPSFEVEAPVRPFVIAIAGGSECSKSLLAELIYQKLDKKVAILGQTDFYKPVPPGTNLNKYNFDEPAAIDWELMLVIIQKYRA